ncbi:hypothetical protein Ato02nite_092170 [Paractinoplanes toevensis]|uniref:Uncharacterized protein n=1 Tax=Paractinoplanes toevensis TaxID=571911 RepID=A0A920BQI2_9ACTN|nr:hypothetical protein Ato02nite_092170 [Actinoplanes toevensis]
MPVPVPVPVPVRGVQAGRVGAPGVRGAGRVGLLLGGGAAEIADCGAAGSAYLWEVLDYCGAYQDG